MSYESDVKTVNTGHISFKSLKEFDTLRRSEDIHLNSVLKIAGQLLTATTLGAYFCAKSALFQDRIVSLILAAGFLLMMANTPSYFFDYRLSMAAGGAFFIGTGVTTICIFNFGLDAWLVIRVLAAFVVANFSWCLAPTLNNRTIDDKSAIRDVSRLIFYGAGPLVTMTAYFGLDLMCAKFLGTYFLGKPLLWKMLATTSVWNFIHSQFIIVKCCTFDRDAIWHFFQTFCEAVYAFYYVPRSIVCKSDEDTD